MKKPSFTLAKLLFQKNEISDLMEWLTYGFGQFINLALVSIMLLVWWFFAGNGQRFPFTRKMIRIRLIGGLLIGGKTIVTASLRRTWCLFLVRSRIHFISQKVSLKISHSRPSSVPYPPLHIS